jgi:Protein of unknown function (DUF721).
VSSSSFTAIIKKYFYHNGGWLRIRGELAVYYWPRIAGEEIAKKVEAVRYRDGILYLQTEIPALAQQLLLMVPNFLEKYQKILGKSVLKGIKVKVGTTKQSVVQPQLSVNDFLLEKSEVLAIDDCKNQIHDPELAAEFSKLMQKAYLDHKKKEASGGKACLSCGVIIDAAFSYCPCCEQKVNEEIKAYVKYQKKNNPDLNQNDPSQMTGLSHLQLKKAK